MNKRHFSTIAEFHEYAELPPPEHPQFSITPFNTLTDENVMSCSAEPEILTNDFYTISFKKVLSGEILYGRTSYDYSNGALIFMGPRQESVTQNISFDVSGVMILIHEDFIKAHDIRNRIKKYSFFSYNVNEALHMSPREEKQIQSVLSSIEVEYGLNPDEFSKDIILSHVDTLLRYANRYYKRQFINRKDMNGEVLSQFQDTLSNYFEAGGFEAEGVPQIEEIAEKLGMSRRYLSDSLKSETGKGAMEHLHLYLLDEAKNVLLEPNITVSEAAYKLGFEYPNYFSRLFKKKVGINPTEYRRQHLVH